MQVMRFLFGDILGTFPEKSYQFSTMGKVDTFRRNLKSLQKKNKIIRK